MKPFMDVAEKKAPNIQWGQNAHQGKGDGP
jgi:hypothetical protein